MKQTLDKLASFLFPSSTNETLETVTFSDKFISLAVNKQLTDNISMSRIIQLEDLNGYSSQYTLFKEGDKILCKFYKKNRITFDSPLEDKNLNQIYINKISEAFIYSIDSAKDILKKNSEVTSDLNSEAKGLEWLKVTLIVLKSAINASVNDPQLIFNSQFFCGKRKSHEDFQLRIQCLSLDFLLEFLEDGRVKIQVWDYKNLEPNPKSAPSFSAEFVKLKKPVFDEFIQLIVEISKAATKIY